MIDSELRDLYQELILDHGKHPRNHHPLKNANATADGNNPLCGDRCTVYANLHGGTIADISFEGKGCAISQASASLMTEAVKGKTTFQARHLSDLLIKMVKGQPVAGDMDELGKLVALDGVKEFPMRVKCATLPWHTLLAALDGQSDANDNNREVESI